MTVPFKIAGHLPGSLPSFSKKPGGKGQFLGPFPHLAAHRPNGDGQKSELMGPLAVGTAHPV